jgi:hypothetical protein
LLDFLVSQTKKHVFRFEICVNYPTDAVEEVESHQDLASYLFDQMQRKSLIVIALEDFEKVDS